MQIFIVFFFVLLTTAISADGIPVANGKVLVEHTVIDLTESQAEEVEVLETLTLTSDQWTRLRKIGSECPKRFDTLFPMDYGDCTCADRLYAILLSRRKAAVLHSQINGEDDRALRSVFTSEGPTILGSQWDAHHQKDLHLQVDGKGQVYLGGVSVPFEKLQKFLSYPQMDSVTGSNRVPNTRTIIFRLAPGIKADESLREKYVGIKNTAMASGWKVEFIPSESWGLD